VSNANRKQRCVKIEPLEARTLFSADLMSAGLDIASDENNPQTLDDTGWLASNVRTAQAAGRFELVFIVDTTPDYQKLIDDLQQNSTDTRIIEIVVIGENENGINKITETLAGYDNIDAM